MGSSMIGPAPTPAGLSAAGGWLWPSVIAVLSVALATVAWRLVATRDLRHPLREIRQSWRLTWRTIRLPLESLTVGVATMLAVWWGWLANSFDYQVEVTRHQAVVVASGICCVGAFAMVALAFVRVGQRTLLWAVAAMAGWSTAGLVALVHGVDGDPPLWTLSVLVGALPLIVTGLSTYHVPPLDGSPAAIDVLEHRDTRASTVTTVAATGVVALALPLDKTAAPERMATLLVVSLVLLFAIREGINAYFRVRLSRRLQYQAVHDQLTGLPNRRGLAQALAAVDPAVPSVVVVLDLDGFKRVNDELGYQAGDRLLTVVSERLAAHCPPPRFVARLGGDEFAVLSPGDLESGRRLALTLRKAVHEVANRLAPTLPVSASIGVGRLHSRDEDETTPDGAGESYRSFAAVAEASAALRAAKVGGKDRIEVYAGRTERARRRRIALELRLRHALETNAIEVHLQPIVRLDLDTPSGPVVQGFEALARWDDPELGVVVPSEFVAVAEQTGLIVPLGDAILRRSVTEAAEHGLFAAGLRLSINVSPLQLRAPGFAATVLDTLRAANVAPRMITLEITEAVLIDEDDPGLPVLAQLNAAGLQLAIDDFGTGHAALAYLRRLPLNVLKIDRSLTAGAVTDPRSRAVVTSMIHLARRLEITVVMEGVEDEQIATLCRTLKADLGQGWLFGVATSWDRAGTVEGLIELSTKGGAAVGRAAVPDPAGTDSAVTDPSVPDPSVTDPAVTDPAVGGVR